MKGAADKRRLASAYVTFQEAARIAAPANLSAAELLISPPRFLSKILEEAPMLSGCWLYETPQGTFRIEWTRIVARSCFAVIFEQDLLGCYDTATSALTALVQGETTKPRCGLNIERLNLPQSVMGWTFCPATDDADRSPSLRHALQAAAMKCESDASAPPEQALHQGASPQRAR